LPPEVGCPSESFDLGAVLVDIWKVDAERTIAEIEWLERIFAVPDKRPLTASDLVAANQRHDQKQSSSPWFRLWQRYGVCCRTEAPAIRLAEPGT
jgi:hypothetical protein